MVAFSAATAAMLPANPVAADGTRDGQWHLRYLKVAEAHQHSQGAGITVAVVDSGVHPHPDLRDNLLSGTDVIPGGSGDGRADINGHGTGMAGLIAAHGRPRGDGVLGIAPKAKILPIRESVGSGDDPGSAEDIAAGIQWAIAHGAGVINVSTAQGPSSALKEAVEAAWHSDIVLVAGAGNRPYSFGVAYPALYDGVIAVGAVDRNGRHAEISVKGPEVDISAPGVEILSTGRNGEYTRTRGTSDSTALVSGAVALVRSKFPDLSAPEVIHRLTATATDKGPPGRDDEYGFGVLNLVAALTADVPPLASTATPAATSEPVSASPSRTTVDAAPPGADSGGAGGGSTTVFALVAAAIVGGAAGLIGLVIGRRRQRARVEP